VIGYDTSTGWVKVRAGEMTACVDRIRAALGNVDRLDEPSAPRRRSPGRVAAAEPGAVSEERL